VETICREVSNGEVVAPANFNCPGQIAISGHAGAVNRAVERVKQQGKKAMLLPVSAPFHSPLMKEAGERLAQEFDKIVFNDLQMPVVTNVEAEINTSKEKAKALLVVQVSSPVRWEESMQRMVAEGVERMVEIGPGKVLCGMMKRINPSVAAANVEDTKTLQALSLG
jgi:[acyl-carrier-protein] S-malonyltransferase